jgi:hypothetical protein
VKYNKLHGTKFCFWIQQPPILTRNSPLCTEPDSSSSCSQQPFHDLILIRTNQVHTWPHSFFKTKTALHISLRLISGRLLAVLSDHNFVPNSNSPYSPISSFLISSSLQYLAHSSVYETRHKLFSVLVLFRPLELIH